MVKVILLSTRARKKYKALDKRTQNRVRKSLKDLSKSTKKRHSNLDIKKLKGVKGREDLFRLRIGKFRIIFHESKEEIKVTDIIHRSQGYEWL